MGLRIGSIGGGVKHYLQVRCATKKIKVFVHYVALCQCLHPQDMKEIRLMPILIIIKSFNSLGV